MHPSISLSLPVKPIVKRIYFPNLDGLRFLAFFSVFLFHSFYTTEPTVLTSKLYGLAYGMTRSGDLGVNFFFVLSGFLITYLLLSERELNGRIAIRAFYMRRVLRIWPLYFVVLVLGFGVLPILRAHFGEHSIHETAQPAYFVLFLANFNNLYYGCQTPALTALWSVCVEEQFYLVWPLLIAAVPTRRLGWLFSALLAANLVFRALHQTEYMVLNLHTFSVIGDMTLGGMVAWLCFRDKKLTTAIGRLPRWNIGLGYVLGITLLVEREILFSLPGYIIVDRLILAIFFAFVLLEQNYARHSFVKMGQLRWLSYWGTYTYGLYCLHFMALLAAYQLMHRLGLNHTVEGVVVADNLLGLALAMLASWLSFTYYEKPFLKLKNRFAFIKSH